ncbi:MAG: hypothetical protein ACPLKV_00125 [Minisyncoccia bacterium]
MSIVRQKALIAGEVTNMKPFWKVVTMVAADVAGAAIGALAGANPATIVGGATAVSTCATTLLK